MRVLDVRGEICPVPLVETIKELKKMRKGEVLKVISDHPPAKRSIPLEMKERKQKFKLVEKGADFEIIIDMG
jgi:tRNA 2-thiouridine synthesizing protein A